MAETEAQEAEPKRSFLKGILVAVVVGVVSGGIGFSVPILFPALIGHETNASETVAQEPKFVPFGEVIVNLNEGRMNRYLRLSITLQIDGDKQKEKLLTDALALNKSILHNWLLGYLADMQMDDIRGAAGQNRLRREIHDQFNWVLYPDGNGEIADVLFEEFNVQ